MTAADAIASLDGQIAEHGQDILLRRSVPNTVPAQKVEKPHRAFVRGYRIDEVGGGIAQGDSLIILSPTGMPGEFTGASLLRINDKVIFADRTRNVKSVDPVLIGGEIVRLNVTVTG